MIVRLKAKGHNLQLDFEIRGGNPITNAILSDPKQIFKKRLDAVAVGIRSELLMFLLEIEKETDIK